MGAARRGATECGGRGGARRSAVDAAQRDGVSVACGEQLQARATSHRDRACVASRGPASLATSSSSRAEQLLSCREQPLANNFSRVEQPVSSGAAPLVSSRPAADTFASRTPARHPMGLRRRNAVVPGRLGRVSVTSRRAPQSALRVSPRSAAPPTAVKDARFRRHHRAAPRSAPPLQRAAALVRSRPIYDALLPGFLIGAWSSVRQPLASFRVLAAPRARARFATSPRPSAQPVVPCCRSRGGTALRWHSSTTTPSARERPPPPFVLVHAFAKKTAPALPRPENRG